MANPLINSIASIVDGLRIYKHSSKVKDEVYTLVAQVPSLVPRAGPFSFNNAPPQQLLYLEGTVPIYYQNTQYNIPMRLWILNTFPENPPVCYVTPTPDMSIKHRHKHVDSTGLCYLPYIHEWNPNRSTLPELVLHVSSIFGNDPPVFSVARPAQQPAGQMPGGYPHQQQQQQGQAAYPVYDPSRDDPQARAEENRRKLVSSLTAELQKNLMEFHQKITAQMTELSNKQSQLQAGREAITKGLESLNQEKEQLLQYSQLLTEKTQEIEKWLEAHDNDHEIDPESLVEPADPLTKQMFEAVAADWALEDAIDSLDEALTRDAIDLTNYLKHLRTLARDQFMRKAMIKKILERQRALSAPPPV